ncbi:MAG: lytic transglycosylase domain-containing protein, partial [Sphingomonadaceae bacterium]
IALRRLNRPSEAVKHFNHFRAAVNTPISMSRGEYWLGRAEKAKGDQKAATAAFERAASYFDYFYGQLAAEELGRLPQLPATMAKPEISPAARQAFNQSALVQALNLLAAIDHRQHETQFVRALANAADTPEKARLTAEYGLTIDRPDVGVWTWKAARDQQEFSGIELAYPRLPAAGIATIPSRERVLSHAIARQESSFDRTALSPAGARGLMQLMPATASDVARRLGVSYDVNRLFSDPAYNLRLGSYYLGMRRDGFSSAMLAIAAYNGGAGNVRKWLAMNGDPRTTVDPVDWVEMIPFSETRNYVQRVIENAVVYSLLDPNQSGANPRASSWLRGG